MCVGTKSWLISLFLLLAFVRPSASQEQDPQVLLSQTIEILRERVLRDEELIAKDAHHAIEIVDTLLSPHVDMRLSSRLVLGSHWDAATVPQREAFVDGLTRLLLRVFATHISGLSSAEVTYSPTEYRGEENTRAVVRTQVTRPGFSEVPVDYRFYQSTDGWKVYDVSIFGISLIKTYHLTVEAELEEVGLDGVIERINAKSPLPDAAALSDQDPVQPPG
ncbi:MAG: phospholipid transport system substrate-binding protein [Gammaproteobacteria bacterium]|jgi:phospholipid transport system substrate-binding protein